ARPAGTAGRPGRGDARRTGRVRRAAARGRRRAPPAVPRVAQPSPPPAVAARPRPARGGTAGQQRQRLRRSAMSILTYDFMIRAMVAAVFTGLAAPAVGTYLVQRRLALMG